MMLQAIRHKIMDKVFLVILGMIVFFAWMDSRQILSFFAINTQQGWDLYAKYTGPAIWLTWYVVLAVIAVIWYLIHKDKSESLALFLTGATLIWFGSQDLFYFYFSEQELSAVGCWASGMPTVHFISSSILKETCPTATSFLLSGLLGILIAYYLYFWLKNERW